MLVRGISLCNYRNYKNLQIEFHPSLNILFGENAQGKTNILESIFYAATGKSHRTNYDDDLVLWGEKFFNICLLGEKRSGKQKVDIITRTDGKKILKVNGQHKKKLSELIGTINVVLFSPEDMMLVKGGPSVRRRFLDIEISQTSPFYCHSLTNYNKILTQRNNLLKSVREKKENIDMIEIWDQQLVEYGTNIIKKRAEVIEKLIPLAGSIHKTITEGKEKLSLLYKPSIDTNKKDNGDNIKDYFLKKLKENRKMEIIRGITTVGPHRDDIEIKIGEIDIKSFGSQGQQRTAALSMKLSEVEFMKMEIGEYPILLLDDVMSELDAGRQRFLMESVKDKIQTFITSTGVTDVFEPMIGKSRIFEVKNGKIHTIQEG